MALTARQSSGRAVNHRLVVAFRSDDGVWCDINKPVKVAHDDNGVDRVLNEDQVEIVFNAESNYRKFVAKPFDLKLDNNDAFFNTTLPVTMYDDTDTARTISSVYGATLRLSLVPTARGTGWTSRHLGIFTIEDMEDDADSGVCTVTLASPQKRFQEQPADSIMDGGSWYERRSAGYIAKKIVERVFGNDASFATDFPPPLLVDGETGDEVAFAHYGKPGDLDETGDYVFNDGFIPTSMAGDDDFLYVGGANMTGPGTFNGRLVKVEKATGKAETIRSEAGADSTIVVIGVAQGKVWFWTVGNINDSGFSDRFCRVGVLRNWDITTETTSAIIYSGSVWICLDSWRTMSAQSPNPSWIGGFGNFRGENLSIPCWQQPMVWVDNSSPPMFAPVTTFATGPTYDTNFDHMDNTPNVSTQDTGWRPSESLSIANHNYIRTVINPYPKVAEIKGTLMHWLRYDRVSDTWRHYKLTLSTLAITQITLDFAATSPGTHPTPYDLMFRRQVTAWAVGNSRIYIASMSWEDENADADVDNVLSSSRVDEFNLVGTFQSNHHSWSVATAMFTIVWLDVSQQVDDDYLIGCVFDRHSGQFGLTSWDENDPTGTLKIMHSAGLFLPISSGPFMGWSEISSGLWHILDCASGNAWALAKDLSTAQQLGSGSAAHERETWLACPVLGKSEGVSFGITAPYAPIFPYPYVTSMDPAHNAVWSMWELSTRRSLLVEIADFEDKTCDEALDWLVELAGDYVIGFDVDFKFIFRPRNQSPAFTLIPVGEGLAIRDDSEFQVSNLVRRINYRNIVNSVEVTPYHAEVVALDINFDIQANSTLSTSVVPMATQYDRRRKRIALRCVSSGTIGRTTSLDDINTPIDTDNDSTLLWTWVEGVAEIIAETSQNLDGDTTIVIVEGLRNGPGLESDQRYLGNAIVTVGDYCYVGTGPERQVTSYFGSTGLVLNGNMLTTADVVPARTRVRIIPKNASRGVSSEEGITTLDEDLGTVEGLITLVSVKAIKVGMILQVNAERMRVTSLINGTNDITVVRDVLGTEPTTHLTGDTVRAYIHPVIPNAMYEVGDTSIAIGFLVDTDENLDPEERRFSIGDRISIEASGERAVKARYTKITADEAVSIGKWGKRTGNRRADANRLLNYEQARSVVRSIINLQAFPPYEIDCDVQELGALDLFGAVSVVSPRAFPDETANEVDFLVASMRLRVADGSTKVKLRSLTPATTDAGGGGGGGEIP